LLRGLARDAVAATRVRVCDDAVARRLFYFLARDGGDCDDARGSVVGSSIFS
jgi:hypothetical protein